MPANTSEFTNQVVPNSSANCTTLLVSSNRNAAPMKNRSTYGRIWPNGAPEARRTITTEASRIAPSHHR